MDIISGKERVVYAEKGMVTQRAAGIDSARSEFILVVDDDVTFSPDLVETLYNFGSRNELDCVLPMEGNHNSPLSETIDLRYPFITRIRGFYTGQLFQTNGKSVYLDKITVTAGHKVYLRNNHLDKCYLCQTGNFQCFFIRTSVAKAVRLGDEKWLQQGLLSPYAAYDDTTFFYKLFLLGGRIAYSLRTCYTHLDAASGWTSKTNLDKKKIRYYTIARNRTVFWYRFLLQTSDTLGRKLITVAGGIYAMVNYALLSTIVSLRPGHLKCIQAVYLGYADAFKTIRDLTPTGLSYCNH